MNSTRNILSNLIFGSSNYLLYLCFWSIHSCDSNIVVEFRAQLLGRTKYCWNWIDVWSDGLRTIIFWQGWFIPHALRKCPQIVHVKTSECNRCLSIWMHCDAQYFFFIFGEKKHSQQVSRRFVYSRHVIFHARWVGRVQILQEIRMTTCSYCKVRIHIKNVKSSLL